MSSERSDPTKLVTALNPALDGRGETVIDHATAGLGWAKRGVIRGRIPAQIKLILTLEDDRAAIDRA